MSTNGTTDIKFTVFKGSPEKKIVKGQNHRDNLVGDQLLIRMTHSGLCGSDEHFAEVDMCLGHEGAGVVEAVGPKASCFKVGDKVAFGFQRGACGTCSQCLDGQETFCPEVQFYGYCDHDVGSMASHTVFREAFCYRIPEGMAPDTAAGLMCGGATVFNIFDNYDVKPTHRVGVIGLGGLGHLAIQYAAKMGCQVVAFSRTEDKRAEAMKYGAHEFVVTEGVEDLTGTVQPVHHLIQCASFQVPWKVYLPVLYKPGTIYPLTVSFDELSFPYMQFVFGGVRTQAILVAPGASIRRMLEFSQRHGVKATIERYPLDVDGIEKAFQDLRDGKTRYKAILYAEGQS